MHLNFSSRAPRVRALVCGSFCVLLTACGARTGVRSGTSDGGSGSNIFPDAGAGTAGGGGSESCVRDNDCFTSNRCLSLRCVRGECVEAARTICDDRDSCTEDSCNPDTGACTFRPLSLDLDGDGHKSPRPGFRPGAPGSCGDDCDDRSAAALPGGEEICDGLDNDCNGVVDDGATYEVPPEAPRRLSSTTLDRAARAGIAFDGQQFGITYTGETARSRSYFQSVDIEGETIVSETSISNVNAETYAGGLVFNGGQFATAWPDARQGGNYEIYFNRIAANGERLGPDVRLSVAEQFSLNPVLAWNGSDFLVLWDDRRFDTFGTDDVRIFGQRVGLDGALLGDNLQITPGAVVGEYPSLAIGSRRVGIAFASLAGNTVRAQALTTAPDFSGASQVLEVGTVDAQNPNIVPIGQNFAVIWEQYGDGPGRSIWGAVISEDGEIQLAERALTTSNGFARSFAVLPLGDRMLLVWGETANRGRNARYALMAQTFSSELVALDQKRQITNIADNALEPALSAGADGTIGVVFNVAKGANRQVYFMRLLCATGLE